jgi:hypothetical protein
MSITLKISKPFLAMLVTVVNAAAAFAGVVIQIYVQNPTFASASYLFLNVTLNAVTVYLTTEEQQAPAS